MTKEKQIEELAKKLRAYCYDIELKDDDDCRRLADFIIDTLDYRKQSENATLEAVDKFRSALMDKFIDLCRGNDFNKINLLLIGETIDRTFDDVVAKMKGGE